MNRQQLAEAERFSSILQAFLAKPDEEHTLQSVVDLAVATIDGCEWAGISLRRGDNLETPASTDPIVLKADGLQYEFAEGPCVDTIWVDQTYVIRDMQTETRWPKWAPAAHDLGIRSVLSVRLATAEMTVGGLNMYSSTVDAYDEDDVQVAHVYAAHAAAALSVSHEISTLHTALQTRHTIGLAQGILMHRYRLTVDQAFQVLRRTSQSHNVKLRELAEQVVAEHGMPEKYGPNGSSATAQRMQ